MARAVKWLKLDAGTASLSRTKDRASTVTYKVVPVLDAGQARNPTDLLVMPVCDYSLQGKILGNTPLPWPEAQQALLGIVDGRSKHRI